MMAEKCLFAPWCEQYKRRVGCPERALGSLVECPLDCPDGGCEEDGDI